MQTLRKLVFLLAMMSLSTAAFAGPQQHVVSPDQLAAAVADHAAAQDADRTAIREALAAPQVRDVAASMGVDAARLASAVDTMNGTDLRQAANAARQVNQQLVGGASTIVISTTTVIIILLVLILLVVALK